MRFMYIYLALFVPLVYLFLYNLGLSERHGFICSAFLGYFFLGLSFLFYYVIW